jgi:hypothetical protein
MTPPTIWKRFLIAFLGIGLLVAPLTFTGCKTPATQQGDAVAVNADKAIMSAFIVIDEFLLWERQNQAVVSPAVHRIAEDLRREAPDAFRTARAVLRAYRERPSPEQADLLSDWLTVLQSLAGRAQTHLAR